jgi:hypothetical protein
MENLTVENIEKIGRKRSKSNNLTSLKPVSTNLKKLSSELRKRSFMWSVEFITS